MGSTSGIGFPINVCSVVAVALKCTLFEQGAWDRKSDGWITALVLG